MTSLNGQDHRPRDNARLWAGTAIACTAMFAGSAAFIAMQFMSPRAPDGAPQGYGAVPYLPSVPPAAPIAPPSSAYVQRPPAYAPPAPPPQAVYAPPAPVAPPISPQAPVPQVAAAAPPTARQILQRTADPQFWLVSEPGMGGRVYDALRQLAAVEVLDAAGSEPILAFFDPRCHYCHAAHQQVDGRISIRWIPVPALGEFQAGNAVISTFMGAADPRQAMRQVLENQKAMRPGGNASLIVQLPVVPPDAGRDGMAKVTLEAYAQLAQVLQAAGAEGVGVPLFVLRTRSGQVGIFIGNEPDLAQRLSNLRAS